MCEKLESTGISCIFNPLGENGERNRKKFANIVAFAESTQINGITNFLIWHWLEYNRKKGIWYKYSKTWSIQIEDQNAKKEFWSKSGQNNYCKAFLESYEIACHFGEMGNHPHHEWYNPMKDLLENFFSSNSRQLLKTGLIL